MKFAIITHVAHKIKEEEFYAYEPYVREMNLWLQHVTETKIVAPVSFETITPVESNYIGKRISLVSIPGFHVLNITHKIRTLFKLPIILFRIFQICWWADHIHLRCPGNIGLLGCFVQLFFPWKKKTVKYAGNWDPHSKQPLSYRIQKWITSNTFLTKNCKVLVYGEWENQTKNILPFFTATYQQKEIITLPQKGLNKHIKFIYVGGFTKGKQPLLSVKVVEQLYKKGYDVMLNMYGNGEEYSTVANYVTKHQLKDIVHLHGNQSKEVIKKAFQETHFLIFISKSEGWPKVVAEAMFWSCLPVSTRVSCVPNMLEHGERGILVSEDVNEITEKIEQLLKNEPLYLSKVNQAKEWSQQYTLDSFHTAISKLV